MGGLGSGPRAAARPLSEHAGLAKRLRAALESGNDDRVYSLLKEVVDECMMSEE